MELLASKAIVSRCAEFQKKVTGEKTLANLCAWAEELAEQKPRRAGAKIRRSFRWQMRLIGFWKETSPIKDASSLPSQNPAFPSRRSFVVTASAWAAQPETACTDMARHRSNDEHLH